MKSTYFERLFFNKKRDISTIKYLPKVKKLFSFNKIFGTYSLKNVNKQNIKSLFIYLFIHLQESK